MPKTTLTFEAGAYAPVADRIALFYERHPTGRIITELVERSEVVVFKALVYRGADDPLPAATGWASERVGDGEINAVACVENTETSAIGRALANLGFTASNRRPSAEEMDKASRERARLARERVNPSREAWQSVEHAMGSGPRPPWAMDPPTKPHPDLHVHAHGELRVAEPDATPWPATPAVIDALDLLAEAERAGMDRERVGKLRARLAAGNVAAAAIERVERALRRWLSDHESPVGIDAAGD